MKPIDLFLTKESFDAYATRLREEKAREYGMTLEEWDAAVLTQQTVNPITSDSITQSNNNSGSKTI
jgi:hypothetical protein